MICLYIYRACSFSVCVAVLLTLILTLHLRSSPLLQSQTANLVTLPNQTANLVTLPNLTARPVPILRQNVMPVLLTSVINSTPWKTNNTSIIKREPPLSNPGYDYGIYPCKLFLLYRENWNIQYSDYEHNLVKCLPSNIEICYTPPPPPPQKNGIILRIIFLQFWVSWTPQPCKHGHILVIQISTPQLSEMGHIKNLYLHHRDTYVAGKTGLSTFQKGFSA